MTPTIVKVVDSTDFAIGDHLFVGEEQMVVLTVMFKQLRVERGALNTNVTDHYSGETIETGRWSGICKDARATCSGLGTVAGPGSCTVRASTKCRHCFKVKYMIL